MKFLFSVHWVLLASIWYFVNGVLHDTFVLIEHKGGYNRELLRLLTDGHTLLVAGAVAFVAYLMMLKRISYGAVIGIITGISMLIFCAMIFPFLESYGTIAVSIMLVVASVRALTVFTSINK